MAGTFATLGLVLVSLLVAFALFRVRKRRRARYESGMFFQDKMPENEPGLLVDRDIHGASPTPSNGSSSGPPMVAYSDNPSYYNIYRPQHTPQGSADSIDSISNPFLHSSERGSGHYYGAEMTQAYQEATTPDIMYSYAASAPLQYPTYVVSDGPVVNRTAATPPPPRPPSTSSNYSNPFEDSNAALAPPKQAHVDRGSLAASTLYTPSSVDSFYGRHSAVGGTAL